MSTSKLSAIARARKNSPPNASPSMYRVIDSAFNRRWYPELIGQVSDDPPSYAYVKPEEGN